VHACRIINPLNHFIGNVAAASDESGFWIMLPSTPLHYCKAQAMRPDMNPQKLSMGVFDGNSVHSSNAGLVIDQGICDTLRAPACGGMYDPPDLPKVGGIHQAALALQNVVCCAT
jgi:hypothetical protein